MPVEALQVSDVECHASRARLVVAESAEGDAGGFEEMHQVLERLPRIRAQCVEISGVEECVPALGARLAPHLAQPVPLLAALGPGMSRLVEPFQNLLVTGEWSHPPERLGAQRVEHLENLDVGGVLAGDVTGPTERALEERVARLVADLGAALAQRERHHHPSATGVTVELVLVIAGAGAGELRRLHRHQGWKLAERTAHALRVDRAQSFDALVIRRHGFLPA